jgi:4-amino-4-deoxy-L-arabinose transferase-like glycosyltransferase
MLHWRSDQRVLYFSALVVVLAAGMFLRLPSAAFIPGSPLHVIGSLHPTAGFSGVGFDEGLYREYVNVLGKVGLGGYPDIVERYISLQKKLPGSVLPPVRFLYIFAGYTWHRLFGTEALAALHNVAAFFSILMLILTVIFTWRSKGPAWALGVGALMACAPTQIHMSQHALVDGFFAFWTLLSLWLLWENLQAQHRVAWLVPYILALALLVLTKENAFFVLVAVVVVLLSNRWLHFGIVTRELLFATVMGPLLGLVILIFLAGGLGNLIATYQLSVGKNLQLAYAIRTGDGPWYRYIVDLLLVSPIIVILAIGAMFRLDRTQKPELFFAIFIASSYLVMCNVKYGMNLRYTNMWDMPLRFLAFGQIVCIVGVFARYRIALIVLSVGLLCLVELRQYLILFVHYPLYELVNEGLLRALKILKSR